MSAAISFFYSTSLGLYVQLGILVVSGTVGTVTFCLVEWSDRYNKKSQSPINSESSDPDNISPQTPALPHD